MNKTLKILLCFLAMILSLGTTFLVIGYEKEKKVSDELVMADNYENNVLTANNDSLTTLEKVIIYIAIVIFIFSLLTLITFLIKIEGIWTSHYYRVVYLLLIFILSSLTSQMVIYFTNKNILMTNHNGKNQSYSSYIVSPKGIKVLENNISLANENYYGNKKDTNVILIKNGSQVTLDNFVIRKVSDSNNIKIAKIYGINAAILVLKDSQLSLKKSNIETSDNGSVGLCAALKNANISVENTNINTSGDNSFGILGSFDSHIDVNYTNIKTGSTYSSAINAIKNSQINVNNALLETNGNNSPIITTDSIIKINNSTGDANSSYLALVEENGNLSIKNSNFRASALHMSDEEDAGILIKRNTSISNYQEKSIVDISNSTLEIKDQ